jgi:hypothetical protein
MLEFKHKGNRVGALAKEGFSRQNGVVAFAEAL